MESAGDRGGARSPAPPAPGRGDTGKGDRGSGWIRCPAGPQEPGCPVGFPGPPYMRKRDSWDRRGWMILRYPPPPPPGPPPPLTHLSPLSSLAPVLPSSISELTEVPSLQSLTEPRAILRATELNIPLGLRRSSFGERTSEGVDGGKRKWVPAPVGTGGAL